MGLDRSAALLRWQLVAQRQTLGDAESVLLVDDREAESSELDILLDDRVGADDEPRRTGCHALQHVASGFALSVAGEPGHTDTERFQPADELAKVLVGEDFGGGHQGALPAVVDGDGRGERGDDRLAGADVALQQAVHRRGDARRIAMSSLDSLQVGGDLFDHSALRPSQRERQGGEQSFLQAACGHSEQRRTLASAKPLGLQLRQLLRQKLLELDPPPRRVHAIVDNARPARGWRMVQQFERLPKRQQGAGLQIGRHRFAEVHACQRRRHGPSKIGLRQGGGGRVDRRELVGQRRVFLNHRDHRVHHLAAEQSAAGLAPNPQPTARSQHLLLRRIEVQESQQQRVACGIDQRHPKLPAAVTLHLAALDDAFDLSRQALAQIGDRRQARLVLVAQRQVQREVDVASQAELLHRSLRAGLLARRWRCGDRA